MVLHVRHSRLSRAVGATVKRIVRFDAVPDDLAAAVIADGRELMDRTLEAVKRVSRSLSHDFERQVIIVTANFTLRHRFPLVDEITTKKHKKHK